MSENTRICDRCLCEMNEGEGLFFEIRMQAVLDPTPPKLDEVPDPEELRRELDELVAALHDLSPTEAMEQVVRQRVWSLCHTCFENWFQDPFHANPE